MAGAPGVDPDEGETPEEAAVLDALADELEDAPEADDDPPPQITAEVLSEYERQILAAKRLLGIKKARERLLDFVCMSMPDPTDYDNADASRYKPQAHHRYICDLLEKVERGEITRLILNIGPRHGKSELVSRRFPAWFAGRDPYRQVIVASYGETLATDFGRSVRETMRSPFYAQVFPQTQLRKGSQSIERLETVAGGVLNFVGVGGGITGKGADLLVIDDPVVGAEDARSKTLRDRAWEWFTKDALTRLMGAMGRVVICMTRWHEDDIVGRLTDPKNPNYHPDEAARWTVVNLPAFADEDNPLGLPAGGIMWPERITREFLEGQRRLDPIGFNSLYMGRPAPPDGAFFRRAHLVTYSSPAELPRSMRYYAASDHAVSLSARADKTCMGVVGVDVHGDVWVLPDLFWRKADTETVVESMLDLGGRWKPLFWWAERGHISQSIGPFLRQRMREEQTFFTIDEKTPVKDKQTRAQAIQARMAMGKVHLPSFAPWYSDAVEELLAFPNGAHDDFVDFLAWIGLGVDRLVSAERPVDVKPPARTGTVRWILESSAYQSRQQDATRRYFA